MTAARRARFAADAALVLAALIAVASTAGIFIPSTYGAETDSWRTQGVVQDWIDLVIAVPWLLASGIAARAGSRRGHILLAGALVFVVYSFAIYGFAVHFNRVFLLYCAVLGLSVCALVDAGRALLGAEVPRWFDGTEPRRRVAAFQIGSALVFGGLWLSQIVAAYVRGAPPPELAANGLASNPVHVLDLSLMLPALLASGIALWRRRPIAYVAAPVLLAFAVLMNINVTVLTIVLGGPVMVSAALAVMSAVSAVLLLRFLGSVRRHLLPLPPPS